MANESDKSSGKVIFVTRAGAGIGKAVALEFVREGASPTSNTESEIKTFS
jgi:NAD(P)-dependent dehydrogenase (short-subunit alcohol dehydrogenase family)